MKKRFGGFPWHISWQKSSLLSFLILLLDDFIDVWSIEEEGASGVLMTTSTELTP
jgi:hypothetical protein